MDASPAAESHDHFALSSAFSSWFPLPLRILALISLGILAWASNLHILSWLGIDTSAVLDVRVSSDSSVTLNELLHPSKLYPPVYKLALLYFTWTALGWLSHSFFGSYGDTSLPEHVLTMAHWIPAAFAITGVFLFLLPLDRLYRRERLMAIGCLRRTLFGTLFSPVPFGDVILADFLTSYAKVMGDVWICIGMLVGLDTRNSFGGRWGVPLLTSLPYLWRFRQCISEVCILTYSNSTPSPASTQIATTPRDPRLRSMCNALKYASALPVIILSALQSQTDFFADSPEELAEAGVWLGTKSTFRLWILAVLFNSLYSFWWDVTNDWGLGLLVPKGWRSPLISLAPQLRRVLSGPSNADRVSHSSQRNGKIHTPRITSLAVSTNGSARGRTSSGSLTPDETLLSEDESSTKQHSRIPSGLSASTSHAITHPFLRQHLLLSDPIIYYLVVALDLLLRLTWSLKLSSHLHSIHEIEQGIFLMEALEVVRRWMWCFIRIEFESVKQFEARGGFMPNFNSPELNGHLLPMINIEKHMGKGVSN